MTQILARRSPRILSIFVIVLTSLIAVAPSRAEPQPTCTVETCTVTFSDPTQVSSWTVPAGVSRVELHIVGGAGSNGYQVSSNAVQANATDVGLTFARGDSRALVISVGGGAIGATGGRNPLGEYSGGDGALAYVGEYPTWTVSEFQVCCFSWIYHVYGGGPHYELTGAGGAASVVNTGNRMIVVGGTAGTSETNLQTAELTSGTSGAKGMSQSTPGGGGGLRGGNPGYSGSSSDVLTREAVSPGANGYVRIQYKSVKVPTAPINLQVQSAAQQASIYFAPPVDDGGASVDNYEYSIDGGSTWSALLPAQASSPIVISGLTNGSNYSIRLRAVNAVGLGNASDSVSVKPIAPASAPTISGVGAGNGQATLSITAPSQINDSSLSGYDYSINNGQTWSHFASVDGPFTITGLTNATAYQVKVRAVNSAGPGAASDAVTVNPTKLIPAIPAIASITRGNGQATVNVKAPTGVTAQSITGYQYNLNNGALWKPVTLTDGSFTITGLTNGSNYAVQIRAVNANGLSGVSGKVSVTPMTTAGATTIQSIKSLNGGLAVTFGGVAIDNGGSVAKNYQYTLDGGSTWTDCAPALKLGPLMTIKGLTNGTTYQVAIRMVNAVGPGAASNVIAGTPMTTPSAPVVSNASVGRTTATLTLGTFVTGGTAITGYAYSLDNKTWTAVTPVSGQFTVSGLKLFTTYKIYVRASNVIGNGPAVLTTVKTLK